jgi:hypothetical protein
MNSKGNFGFTWMIDPIIELDLGVEETEDKHGMVAYSVIVFRIGSKINFTKAGLRKEFLHFPDVFVLRSGL